MRGRKRQATPDQEAEILRLHAEERLGSLKIAGKLGLRRGLVWRVLHRKRPVVSELAQLSALAQLPGSPTEPKLLPLPPQPDQWYKRVFPYSGPPPVVVPPGVRLVRGRCPACQTDTDIAEGVGLCASCIGKELNMHHSRPIGWMRCSACSKGRTTEPVAIHQITEAGPVCGFHKRALYSYSAAEIAERTPPRRNSLGLWWDPDGAGGAGCWKA